MTRTMDPVHSRARLAQAARRALLRAGGGAALLRAGAAVGLLRTGGAVGVLRASGAISLLAALDACSTVSITPQAPRLEFKDVTLAPGTRLGDLRLLLTVQAHNPNRYDLPITRLRFEIEVMDQPLASGAAREEKLVLPASQSRDVAFEIALPTRRLLDVIRMASRAPQGGVPYRMTGSAQWGDAGITLPFERRGTLDPGKALGALLR